MNPNTGERDRSYRNRTVPADLGAGDAIGQSTAPASQRKPRYGRPAPRPLEHRPSALRYVIYAGRTNRGTEEEPPVDGTDSDPLVDFGYPSSPAIAGVDPSGTLFDTTAATVTAEGETIHYALEFGGHRTPYVLDHEGGGTYTSRDAVATFEWTDDERFPLPGLSVGRTYRAVVRDVVQLYEPDGAFDWSVTRTDVFDRRAGAHAVSLLYLVWDLDGPANDAVDLDRGDAGAPVTDPDGPAPPRLPADATPTVDDVEVDGAVRALIDDGLSVAVWE